MTVSAHGQWRRARRYSYRSLKASNCNLVRAIKGANLHTLVLDHHLLRDLNYQLRIKPLREAAEKHGVKVLTATEFGGRKIEMLEAHRKELYAEYGALKVRGRIGKTRKLKYRV